jgi:hypothetical protein
LVNGFSIACRGDIFHYASLYAQADFSEIPEAQKVFEMLGTQDFEIAIHALENGARILPIYAANCVDAAQAMLAHAVALKELLAAIIHVMAEETEGKKSGAEAAQAADFSPSHFRSEMGALVEAKMALFRDNGPILA